jgi:hypothetical protein
VGIVVKADVHDRDATDDGIAGDWLVSVYEVHFAESTKWP